ncbi:nitrite reductase (NADH) small subunit [Jatrophihabitans sp. GAS493]|uniref:nitrite reductase small subunit NirD n=1 Tax=Jatrophihabitans sp. GAS493 TaxID=1907575 RepID=UPI000BB73BC5|nr:nitrite reductase small subunit NirD [Jatrophihabitans sp. GAS493]SOD70986.1 nitrite reductase (NADH) small subunit [Jatrophihabitans sp. GAS493]
MSTATVVEISEPTSAAAPWQRVCELTQLQPERGVAALIGQTQIAIFRTYDDSLYAIGNIDPFTGAAVLSRGIVGTRGERPTVASPLHKQVFDLATGRCLDNDEVTVASYPVRLAGSVVEVMVEVAAQSTGRDAELYQP